MPSFNHELLVELFRRAPELAATLINHVHHVDLPPGRARLATMDLSQVAPVTYHADAVVVLEVAERPVAAIVVEVQLRRDADKRWAWPVYVTGLYSKLRCPVLLLVLAPDSGVAQWAGQRIDIGHPRFSLEPLVVASANVPDMGDEEQARRMPELALLSLLGRAAHTDEKSAPTPLVAAAWSMIRVAAGLDEERCKMYTDIVLAAVSKAVRRKLEVLMERSGYLSEVARKWSGQGEKKGRKEGREEGREEGLEKGLEKGREEGREEALRDIVLAMAKAKLGTVSRAAQIRVRGIKDPKELERLAVALGSAGDAAAVRKLLRGAR